MHDSSACIARDGELLYAVAEERISRDQARRRISRSTRSARAWILQRFARINSTRSARAGRRRDGCFCNDLKCFGTGQYPVNYSNVLNSTRTFASMAHQNGGFRRFTDHFGPTRAQMRFVDHHLAHAISAYSYSGFDKAAVVVMDGRGAWEASSIWYGHDGHLDHVLTIPWPNSLGLFYAQFTQYLGFVPNSDEWKVMGLAPYGQARDQSRANSFRSNHESYSVNAPLLFERNNGTSAIAKRLGPERTPESEIDDSFKNVAFAVQDACEVAMLALVKLALQKTNCRNVCLAGGVALNSKANGKIQASGMVDKIFVQPAASDDGVALGAVFAPYLDKGGRLPMKPMRHAYLGPEYSDAEIEKALRTYKLRATKLDNVAATTAEMLASGKIIGWFQGRMEFGPRALGHRSILADPRDPEMNAKVNNAVKFREWWRPFAPSMLKEVARRISGKRAAIRRS